MSKETFTNVPVIIQQMTGTLLDSTTQSHIKFNTAQTLRAVKSYCERALAEYDKKQVWDNRTGKK